MCEHHRAEATALGLLGCAHQLLDHTLIPCLLLLLLLCCCCVLVLVLTLLPQVLLHHLLLGAT